MNSCFRLRLRWGDLEGLYAPFGEVLHEYNAYWMLDTIPRLLFNGKELDEESGMYYYSARYFKPPTFISRDELFEKMPFMSSYAYCKNNPVILIDPDGRWPFLPIPALFNSPKVRSFVGKVGSEIARGTANTTLFVGGIFQIIGGGFYNGAKNGGDHMTYPNWGIPRQFDKNWNLETKTSWMGGALGTISWDDGKDVMLNTASVVTAFFPFSQAANTLEKTAENILISTTITTTTSMTVDAINDAKSTSTTNSNNSTNTNTKNTQSSGDTRFIPVEGSKSKVPPADVKNQY